MVAGEVVGVSCNVHLALDLVVGEASLDTGGANRCEIPPLILLCRSYPILGIKIVVFGREKVILHARGVFVIGQNSSSAGLVTEDLEFLIA